MMTPHDIEAKDLQTTISTNLFSHSKPLGSMIREILELSDSRVGYKSQGQKFLKRAGKYWVGSTSLTVRYTYRQDVATTPTRRRIGDIYCTASRRSTTSPKPLTDKP